MQPPIIVLDDDVEIFESVASAEGYLEPPDVRRGKLRILDREGRPVVAKIVRRLLAEVVKLEDAPASEPKPGDFRAALELFLSRVENKGVGSYSESSIDELLERAMRFKTI